ncbi:MAG: SIR2 family protein [Spirosomataceae bacterium]
MLLDFTKPEIQTLIHTLNRRKALVIAGTGVSSATIPKNERAVFGTWTALLNYGIKFCCEQCRKEENWGDDCRTLLANENSSTEQLLKVGDEIWDCLQEHGKLSEWLNVFENASPEYPELIRAIQDLGIPIATANYDNLLEDITHLTPITLLDTAKVEDFLDTDQKQKYILHLHGYFRKPDSVVLGQKSYDAIVANSFAQFVNQYLVTQFKAVIFVGFGQGVYDQNFSLIFKWVSQYLRNTTLYHIVKDDLVAATKATHDNNKSRNVVVLGYGENYSDLTPFIQALAHNIEHDDDLPKTLEGKPTCIGQNRLDLIENVAQYLATNYKKPAGILGVGGQGKTNLVLNVLHHKAIARKYRRNRFFVRCDGAKDLSLLQNALLNALEIPVSSGDLGDRLLNYLSHQDNRFLIALDNFETAWQDKTKVESFIERLKDHADLVFTYRGNASPDELDWKVFKVPFLSEPDAITLFNENSGGNFAGNPLVKTMVKEVDCLPLAVELLAKRAKKVEKLEDLYRQWQKTRNDFLSKGSDKNTNLNLSISFSYENTRLTDANRAFLQALGYLPQGMNRTDLEAIFDDAYDQLEILKEFGLCEETDQARLWVLAPIREYLKPKITTDQPLIAQTQDFYLDLSKEKGEKVGYEEKNTQILQEEWSNIIKVITDKLETQKGVDTLFSLTLYYQFSGFYPIDLFKKAADIAHQNQWESDEANCLQSLGDLSLSQSENQAAFDYYQQALPLYEKILLGELSKKSWGFVISSIV